MRTSISALAALALSAAPALAQEHGAAAEGSVDLLSPSGGLMFWTLIIFVLLLLVLSKFAFKPLLGAVEAREKSLQDAIDAARQDREAAAALLAEHRAAIDAARGEAQKLIADARVTADRVQEQLLAEGRAQQEAMLARARQEIELDKQRAIQELRREAVDLAIVGAGRVVQQNLDSAANRRIVDDFLATVPAAAPAPR